MPTIIKIQPVAPVFSITWNIGTRCNYDCMYCPTSLHDSYSKNSPLAVLQQRWQSIHEKTHQRELKYKISFTGGKVTANKQFLPLVEWLRTHYNNCIDQILLTTNGSASFQYYEKIFACVDNVSFSLHSEHVNEQLFFNKIIKLHQQLTPGKHLHVNIMNEFWNQVQIEKYVKLLSNHAISHSINSINYSIQTRSYPIMKGKLNLGIN